MAENFDVFSFELSEQDMNEIAKLDKAQSLFFSHYDPELIRPKPDNNVLLLLPVFGLSHCAPASNLNNS